MKKMSVSIWKENGLGSNSEQCLCWFCGALQLAEIGRSSDSQWGWECSHSPSCHPAGGRAQLCRRRVHAALQARGWLSPGTQKMTAVNTAIAFRCEWIKIVPIFLSDWQKLYFLVCHRILVVYVFHEIKKVENHWYDMFFLHIHTFLL